MSRLQRSLLGLLSGMLLASCASTDFSIPAVSATTDGSRQPGRVIWHDLLTDALEQSKTFYSELFGWQFEPLDGVNYTLIRHRGELIGGMVDQDQLPTTRDVSQWVVMMSVPDVERAARRLSDAGGALFTPPTSLGERGAIAVAADPQGAVLALLQTRDGDPPDPDGPPPVGRFLWNELWADDVDAAARFYAGLTGMASEQVTLDGAHGSVDYRLLTAAGRPRAGIRKNPLDATPLWVSYLRVADEASLAAILARVEPLGGRILMPATARPAGGVLAVVTDPSGAGIALQTWNPRTGPGAGRAMR
jgi:predicted enzyme related to lactoylglutathione lyase